jgi:hypothetical protein
MKSPSRHRFGLPQLLLLLCLALAPVRLCAADRPLPDDQSAAAWVRGGQEEYQSIRYHFLGHSPVTIAFDVKPRPGAALELRWGSKRDLRSAVLTVNGLSQPLTGERDYDGFRWLRVPLPDNVTGQRYDVTLSSGAGKAAFIAEARLTVSGGDPAHPDLKLPAYRARSAQLSPDARPGKPSGGAAGEAFPDLRARWDAPLPPPAAPVADPATEASFRLAEHHARQANEALYRSRRFVAGWLAHADPASGLIPRNLTVSRDYWNGRDSAADNYPYMVLTAALTDPPLLAGRMLEMLRTETRLTCRLDRLPDDYSFSKKGWRREQLLLDEIIFDGAEYVKDGLLPITEWLGPSPWSERAIGIVDDIWKNAAIKTPFGLLPTLNFEVNGDLLQACSRLYWFTGDAKYLEWAIRLGDYYLLGSQHPTRDSASLTLGDHSCEVINGLSELYLAVSYARPEKRAAYRQPIHELYDRILEVGLDGHGMMFRTVNPQTGAVLDRSLTDNWGYNYDGYYTVWLVDHTAAYRAAVVRILSGLQEHYTGQIWERGSADGYADSIEGAITLLNREPVASGFAWVDSEIRTMWAKQKPDGVIEGWHGDGNFARTSLMYALWKTQGATLQPWRDDVRFGAVRAGTNLCVSLVADQPWAGRLVFDKARHQSNLHLPRDYPRINMFPEWFIAQPDRSYSVANLATGQRVTLSGPQLQAGLPVSLPAGTEVRLLICPQKTE